MKNYSSTHLIDSYAETIIVIGDQGHFFAASERPCLWVRLQHAILVLIGKATAVHFKSDEI